MLVEDAEIPASMQDDATFCVAIPRREEIRGKNMMIIKRIVNSYLFDWSKGI